MAPVPAAVTFTAADYLLYLRCPRSAHRRLLDRTAADDIAAPAHEAGSWYFPESTDRAEVIARVLDEHPFPATSEIKPTFDAPPFAATPEVWHQQRPEGMAAVIIREATTLKHSYLVEAAFVRYCARAAGVEPSRHYVCHLNKSFVFDTQDDIPLFVVADVTRRVGLIFDEHEQRLDELRDTLVSDPLLEGYGDKLCSRPRSCPVCSVDLPPVPDEHLYNLYRGGELIGTLLGEGYESIVDVPVSRLANQKQRTQQSALVRRAPHVDVDLIKQFLGSIKFPLHYLDFEAINSAIPHFPGAHPWEHVPYLFSVHTQQSPGADPDHHWFLMDPQHDQRRELVQALLAAFGESGTILVYGAAFENGILQRLAHLFPDLADRVEGAAERVVDLLRPFGDFSYYHPSQRGKVSLKTVLPILTDATYDGLGVRDGYSANFAYRYLMSVESKTEATAALCDDLVQYCTMDTMAMVRIVSRLRELVAGPPAV